MKINKRNRVALAGYLALILFWMFLGFGRISRFDSYHFSLTMTRFPLWIPKYFSYYSLKNWVFALGNLVAFVPFGVLIPLNFPASSKQFLKSVLLFAISITILETLQMISLLGSFDIADIVVNTLGFSIGYASWKISKSGKNLARQVLRFCVACIFFVILTMIGAELFNSSESIIVPQLLQRKL